MMNFQQYRERTKAKSFRQVNIDCIFVGLGVGGANFSLSRSFVDALEVGERSVSFLFSSITGCDVPK